MDSRGTHLGLYVIHLDKQYGLLMEHKEKVWKVKTFFLENDKDSPLPAPPLEGEVARLLKKVGTSNFKNNYSKEESS